MIGAAGFVAERHLKAISETGNRLLVASDTFDVMGRMDHYFPDADFFTQFDEFATFVRQIQQSGSPLDFCSICSPNYLHEKHIDFSLHHSINAICEKPLVIFPEELERIRDKESRSGKKVWTILQLRHHPVIASLKEWVDQQPKEKVFDIDLAYITSRGKWYFKSWKGDMTKSGGVVANIGVHFFDMLLWIFGKVKDSRVHVYAPHKAAGFLQLERARVRWFLSLDYDDIPEKSRTRGSRTYRSIVIENRELEFSEGFTNLHTVSYSHIIAGEGFGIETAAPCIDLTHRIRNSPVTGVKGDYHPFLSQSGIIPE